MTATVEEFAQTLASYEEAAIRTGQWNGADAVEFSNDGVNWAPVWAATEDHPHPEFARARVHRHGVDHADWRYLPWAESVPAVDEWRALWDRKPMKLFGAYALRDAIRHAFRDVIGDRRDPDEIDPAAPTTDPAAPAEPRDWAAEYRAATTVEQLDEIRAAVRQARENTDPLNDLYRERKDTLLAEAWGAAVAPPMSMDEAAPILVQAMQANPDPHADTAPVDRPAPRDHLAPSKPTATKKRRNRKGRR